MKNAPQIRTNKDHIIAYSSIIFITLFAAFFERANTTLYILIIGFIIFANKNNKTIGCYIKNSTPVWIYLAYSGISTAWGGGETIKYVKYSIFIYIFYIAIAIAWEKNSRLVSMAIITGLLVNLLASVNMGIFQEHYRLESIFGPHNVIDFAGYLFIGSLISIWLAIDSKRLTEKYIFTIIASILAIGALLTKSRSPLIGMLIALTILLFDNKRTLLTGYILISLLAVKSGLYSRATEGIHSGGPTRFYTWQHAIKLSMESPIFGHGYLSPFHHYFAETKENFHTTHSIYIGNLFYGGITGTIILAWAILEHIKMALSTIAKYKLPSALLTYSLIHISGQGIGLLSHPREFWILFWLPMSIAFGEYMAKNETTK